MTSWENSLLMNIRIVAVSISASLLLSCLTGCRSSSDIGTATVSGEWPVYAFDAAGTRRSPLQSIHRDTVKRLKVAWTARTGENLDRRGARGKSAFEATPLMIEGLLYVASPSNVIHAFDALDGGRVWSFDPKVAPLDYSEYTSRGVTAWLDPRADAGARCRRRIVFGTLDARLIAIDARDGSRCREFGADGEIDLTLGVPNAQRGEYVITSPPVIIGELVITGSAIGDNGAAELARGVVRAFDVRSGAQRWAWDPVPAELREAPPQAWQEGARTGAANAWSILSVDEKRGLVFVPTGSASPDFYGGLRKGRNDYANSVVALHAATGTVSWHFQVVHHDLWDYDVASQPMLITVERDGRSVDAVAVGTKMGHLFVLDRDTGVSLFPVEERAVPRTDVAGEESWPTQPFPTMPPPLVPARLTADDAFGIDEADRIACRDQIASLRNEGIFTPPSIRGSLLYPGNVGGMNWSGMSFDMDSQLLIANTNRLATAVRLIPQSELQNDRSKGAGRLGGEYGSQRGTPYAMHRAPLLSPRGIPCNPPPWGALTAVDLRSGRIAWEVPLGTIDRLRDVPGYEKFGSINLGGSMIAGDLVFIAAAMDQKLRAFELGTGELAWEGDLPASAQSGPMTYSVAGKQYIVIAAGGHGRLGTAMGDYVVAFSLE
jgi:quinoprotein glucose dehydrogenase